MPDGPYLVHFVDSIVASPGLRLDLCNGAWILQPSSDLSPPGLRRAAASTLLADGAVIPASAYDNRVIRLVLRLDDSTASADTAAQQVQKIAREIDRPTNILRWQPGTTNPVFFRTFRAEFDALFWDPVQRVCTVTIPAEPFAYGLEVVPSPITVSNDPAAGANGCYFEVTSVKGDVDTPLFLNRPVTTVGEQSLFAVRRRGTPSAMPFLLQAESMTQGTDTTTQANSGTFSGAGNNYSRTTFTTGTMSTRLSTNKFPSSASIDARGTYRVFARVRRNGSTSTSITARLVYASSSAGAGVTTNDTVSITGTTVQMIDLGMVSIPIGPDPRYNGYDNTEILVEGIYLRVEAARVGGTDTLDTDYLLLVPADDRLAIVAWSPDGTTGTADNLVLDGLNELTFGYLASSGEICSMGSPYFVGGLPMLTPNVTNRVIYINEVGPGLAEPSWPTTWSFQPYYWPRYLYVAPVGS